jgi:glycogen phosphorylase
VHFTRTEGINSVVFVPDYDIHVARLMVAGCDIWLNTPRRPREASGTSGMKAAMNGLPNVSILDGWWDEADVRTGWPIGHGEIYQDEEYQDKVEANAFYDLLEQEVVPMFYDRDPEGIPRRWVAKMKEAIRLNAPRFNTARMVRDYAEQGYFPAHQRSAIMTSDSFRNGKEIAHWKAKMRENWYKIKIKKVSADAPADVSVNQSIALRSLIYLGQLQPSDVRVEVYQGAIDSNGHLTNAETVIMTSPGQTDQGETVYTGQIVYQSSGLQGFSVRVLPNHPYLSNPHELGLIHWA